MKNHLNRPRLRNPFWLQRKERTSSDQLTPENSLFVKQVLYDQYGHPAIVKGVPSYQQSNKSLVKLNELPKSEWTPYARRSGAIARKIGQYPLWTKDGKKIRTTLLQVNHVVLIFF